MQRLLRGRVLYLGLVALLLFLYGRSHPLDIDPADAVRPLAGPQPAVSWWPEPMDAALWQRVWQRPAVAGLLMVVSLVTVGVAAWGVLLTLGAVWTGRLRSLWSFPPARLPPWSLGELVRIVLLIVGIACLIPFVRVTLHALRPTWPVDHRLWMTLIMLVLDSFVVLVILTFAQGKRMSAAEALSLSPGRSPGAIWTGLRGYVGMFPWLFALLFLIVELARYFHIEPPAQPLHELIFLEERGWVFSLTIVLACLVGPCAEEFLFRGVLYPVLRARCSRWAAMALSGAVFALVHTNLVGFAPIMLLGVLLAYLYERTGSLISPLAVHMVHNTLLMSFAVVFRLLPLPPA